MLHFGKLKWGAAYLGTLLAFLVLVPRSAGPANYDIDNETETRYVQTTPTDADAVWREKQECEKATHKYIVTKDGDQRIAPYTTVDGKIVVEDDIVVAESAAASAPVINVAGYKWPGGIVPFEIDQSSFGPTSDQPQLIRTAIADWEKAGVVHFRRKEDSDRNFIIFRNNGDGCRSWIGMHHGEQLVEIGPRCRYHSILHEMGHALGLFHEQSRTDRYQHVKVLWDHIKPEERKQFCRVLYRKNPSGLDISNRYDFGSVMHYPLDDFSICPDGGLTEQCKTIVPIHADELRDAGIKESEVGNRFSLSDEDLEAIRVIYAGRPPPSGGGSTTIEAPSGPITINNPKGSIIVSNPGPIKIYQSPSGGRIWSPQRHTPRVRMSKCCACCYPRMSSCRRWPAPVLRYSYWQEFE
jgi:hypothetical protein